MILFKLLLILLMPNIAGTSKYHNNYKPIDSNSDIKSVTNTSVTLNINTNLEHSTSNLTQVELITTMVKLNYTLIMSADQESKNCEIQSLDEIDLANNTQACLQELGYFNKKDYCKQEQIIEAFKNSITVDGLLPDQQYYLEWYVLDETLASVKATPLRSATICTKAGKPLIAPLAQVSSFSMVESKTILFWRRLPLEFLGDHSAGYSVECFDVTDRSAHPAISEKARYDIGSFVMDKAGYDDVELECHIKSVNNYGESDDYSTIVVPRKSNMVDMGATFLVQHLWTARNNYLVRWDTSPANISLNGPGHFTVYRCRNPSPESVDAIKWTAGCHIISIKIIDRMINYFIDDAHREPFSGNNYGVSFTKRGSTHSTGIIWNICKNFMLPNYVRTPISINHAKFSNQYNYIELSWKFNTCDGLSLFVKRYELLYCPESISTAPKYRISMLDEYKTLDKHEKKSMCSTTDFKSHDYEHVHAFQDKLIPNTRYSINMRYVSYHEISSHWSSPAFFYYKPINQDKLETKPGRKVELKSKSYNSISSIVFVGCIIVLTLLVLIGIVAFWIFISWLLHRKQTIQLRLSIITIEGNPPQ